MKSAEEWLEEMWQAPDPLEYIAAIQRDALAAAAEVCDQYAQESGYAFEIAQEIRELLPPTTSAYGTQDAQQS
jgi:hypothetical protein